MSIYFHFKSVKYSSNSNILSEYVIKIISHFLIRDLLRQVCLSFPPLLSPNSHLYQCKTNYPQTSFLSRICLSSKTITKNNRNLTSLLYTE